MNIFMDMSSIIWTGLFAGTDVEGIDVQHGGRKVHVNTATFGYENVVNSINSALNEFSLTPMDLIMVFEGKDSKKRRCLVDTTYKANREGEKDSRPPEAYFEFNKLKDIIRTTYKNLGAIAVSQDFVEGDDVLAWLALNAEDDCVIVTNDNDMATLNGVNAYGAKVDVRINGVIGVNKYGDFDLKLVSLYKGLVGDASDNIKGCVGFGAAAWMKLNIQYGDDGCFELEKLVNEGKRDEVAAIAAENGCKLLAKLVDQWDSVRKSLRLSTLHPEWVNTVKQEIVWEPGMVVKATTDERLMPWQAAQRLVTADKYAAALKFLSAQIGRSRFVAFDIETSTPDDSDDWLETLGDPNGVDVMGSYLVSYAITFGNNMQYTYYIPVKHVDTDNLTMQQAREMLQVCFDAGKEIVIQNTAFELPVLYGAQDEDGTFWRDHWKKYGCGGMVPNIRDTLFEGSYVNENEKLGLKFRSKRYLGYDQATYQETMTLEGPKGSLPKGGRLVNDWCDILDGIEGPPQQTRFYKMHELPATHTFAYGVDDTITTAALHNFYQTHMKLEHHYHVYLDVELDAAYLHARSFFDGVTISVAKCKELEAEDAVTYDASWAILRKYLMENGWDGTVPPKYSAAITPKEIKEAYTIVMGLDSVEEDEGDDSEDSEGTSYHETPDAEIVKDPFLSTRVRTPSKLVTLLETIGHEEFAVRLQGCLDGHAEEFTAYVCRHFTGEPKFKASNKQMQVLLYQVMKLPIRVRGKVTATMKAAGIREGNPKGNALALAYGKRDASPELVPVLDAISLMQMVRTRRGLYYSKYPYFVHWKTGKVHGNHNQCATNTRRASESKPNKQQLPKHQKIEGQKAKFREVIVPHKKKALIVSMDFEAQELRVIADYSQDANMLACYVGDNLKDMHAMTGAGIWAKANRGMLNSMLDLMETRPEDASEAEYQAFMMLETANPKMYKEYRSLGKRVNFTSEYGAAAPKLAETLLIGEDEAQTYLDAKAAAFPRAAEWKVEVQKDAKRTGIVRTMLGAVRHLAPAFNSQDSYTASKADRQAVNTKIQGSSAEMTKKAEGRMFKAELLDKFDCRYYGPVHDEVVWSVVVDDIVPFLKIAHACMVVQYAKMQVPVGSSISFGYNFSEQAEIGNAPTKEAIAAGLEKLAA